ncbi:hypothetical protein E3J38_00480 [candidate division TA06 bacterium]|uniref:Uncharacterized protein n=1 Tax=candidate division TA06 bacterium TaxID=2250710 RepID=A0A523XVU1_UNCT6|nr:MAG: hypothetical protein E3J38_00480 [candidate division TA06 bacterium]
MPFCSEKDVAIPYPFLKESARSLDLIDEVSLRRTRVFQGVQGLSLELADFLFELAFRGLNYVYDNAGVLRRTKESKILLVIDNIESEGFKPSHWLIC